MNLGAGPQVDGGPYTVGALIADVRQRLTGAGVESAAQEAVWLIDRALGLSSLRQSVDRNRILAQGDIDKAQALLVRRIAREPLQYILGSQEFCGLEFEVNPAVLIPRPETELLVQEIIRRLPPHSSRTLLDVGTGSGCMAVTLALSIPDLKILASDRSEEAIETARKNAVRHGVDSRISWIRGDLLAPLAVRGLERSVTVIASNPPYVAESEWMTLQPEVRLFEPRTALVAGPKGTELQERLLEEAVPFLAPGGLLVMELGRGQSVFLCERARSLGAYCSVDVARDEAGIDRVLIAERAS